MRCARCKASTPPGSRFCPACGATLDPANAPTVTSDSHTHDAASIDGDVPSLIEPPDAGRHAGSGPAHHGRFIPGTLLDRRYRIVGLVGRGGMGEVYRADDLRLGQAVALKLLPEALATDVRRLEQFHSEVRLARQIAHPNVCRVYDIGGSHSRLYLSMEYVDGEDLAASLRRVGHVPEGRALHLARQICAGLAAVHERGVVHRDLKPSNVMLDSAGKVRLMDFGLAAIGASRGSRAGTPAYMAPEQFAGRDATVKSDIYALGLVLYELFTGRRVHDGSNLEELAAQHLSGDIMPPSEIVRGLDPRIERAVLRCLDRDPNRRPTALAVSMLLPGTDPLAAALAAGETPSPEMVAAAVVENAVLSRTAALGWMAAVVVALGAVSVLADRSTVVGQNEIRKSADVLRERAEDVRRAAGSVDDPIDRAGGFDYDRAALEWYASHGGARAQWRGLAQGHPPVVRFWYRTAARALDPVDTGGPVTRTDPAPSQSGDTVIELDAPGRLLSLLVVPAESLAAPATAAFDWTTLIRLAGIEPDTLAAVAAVRSPLVHADDVRAWKGERRDMPGVAVDIEAASFRGRPVRFVVNGPWKAPAADVPKHGEFVASLATALLMAGLVITTVALAGRNVRAGRADWRRASRLALVGASVEMIRWLVLPAHSADPSREAARFLSGAGSAFLYGGFLGAAYLGFEPFIRRYWPDALVSWTRVAGGDVRNPLVGRDLLVGTAFGLFHAILTMSYQAVPALAGWPSPPGWLVWIGPLSGTAMVVVGLAMTINLSLVNALVVTFVITLLRRYARSLWIVAMTSMVVFGLLGDPTFTIEIGQPALHLFWIAIAFVPVFVTLRYGLLALFATALASNLTANTSFTLDSERAYIEASLISAVVILLVAFIGWRLARGRESLFGQGRSGDHDGRT